MSHSRFSLAESGTFWILATAILWSFIGLLSKVCLSAGMDPMESAFLRAFFGGLAFFVHLSVTGQLRIPWKDMLKLVLFGVWGIGCYYTCAQYTIRLCGAAMDIILQYTAPFWVALFAAWIFKERITPAKIFALIVAAAGAFCVCLSGGSIGGPVSWLGIGTGLLSGLCYASHYPFTRWWQGKYSSAVIFAWMLAGGALALGPVVGASGCLRFDFPVSVWAASASTGILCTYLAFYCYGKALRRISLVQAVVTSELEPVLSMLLVYIFFGEMFSPIGWLGSVLIILSVLVLSLKGTKE